MSVDLRVRDNEHNSSQRLALEPGVNCSKAQVVAPGYWHPRDNIIAPSGLSRTGVFDLNPVHQRNTLTGKNPAFDLRFPQEIRIFLPRAAPAMARWRSAHG